MTPSQIKSRELAEKIANKLFNLSANVIDRVQQFPTAESLQEAATELILKELNLEQLVEDGERYRELLYAVESKYEGETRHQTALQLINKAQEISTTTNQAIKDVMGRED